VRGDAKVEANGQAILRRPYHRVITGEPVEGYLGEVPELPGCLTAGATPEEALRNLEEAMGVWIESALVHGDPIPEPAPGPVRVTA
jgi:predicted RNase H-like HicB family nuclease